MAKARHDWPAWVAAAAVVLSLVLHAGFVVRRLPDEGRAPQPGRAAVADPPIDLQGVLAWRPFGQPVGGAMSETAPASGPRLTLLGVVRADPLSRSSAIVAVGTEPARRFVVGDEIADGRRLVEVRSDHVLLEAGGSQEVLSLDDASAPVLPGSDSASRTAGATGDLEALRQQIFDQVGGGGDAVPDPLARDEGPD